MAINPLAAELNETLQSQSPVVFDMLSQLGKALFFPKGILSQSAEAKVKATRYNATIGIATEGGQAMHLDCVHEQFASLSPNELYPYAPSTGVAALRDAWAAKQREEMPSLPAEAVISSPVVTNALTHGLTLAGELLLDAGDEVLVPDMLWGNYRLTWQVKLGAQINTFPFFDENLSGFNAAALQAALDERQGKKIMLVLNFPNNPTGYHPSKAEVQEMVRICTAAAESGTRLMVLCDDAYFGMFYDPNCEVEPIFAHLAHAHTNLLAIKIDGATKEEFVWGLRVGFITFGNPSLTADSCLALEKKVGGAIRGSVSNITMPGQAIVLKALNHPQFRAQQAEKVAVLRRRWEAVKVAVDHPDNAGCWQPYPYNAGYFMCLRLEGVEAEAARVHLLDEHGVGTISVGKHDLRVAFSCLEETDIADCFARIAQTVRTLRA